MSEELPLVSVRIVCYNQKDFIRECIDSVLEQDYLNIEIVIADDCSMDGTVEILKEYIVKYPEKIILALSEKNEGITKNANSGLRLCKGKYITGLGGDDLMLPGKIRKQVEYMEQYDNINLCGTYTQLIDKDGKKLSIKKDFRNKKDGLYSLCELIESGNTLIPVVSYMYRKKVIPKNGFDYRLPIASDSLFVYHCAKNGKIKIINEVLMAYRVHDSHAQKLGYLDDSFVSLALSEFYFPECLHSIKYARGILYYSVGRQYMKDGNSLAKKFLWNSFLLKPNFKTLFVLLLFLLGVNK